MTAHVSPQEQKGGFQPDYTTGRNAFSTICSKLSRLHFNASASEA